MQRIYAKVIALAAAIVCHLSIVLGDVLKAVPGSFHEGQVRDPDVIEARHEHYRAEDEQRPQPV